MATLNGVYQFYTVEQAQTHLQSLIANYTSPSLSFSTLFRQVANGFFMAEGSITGTFRSQNSHWFKPYMSLSQNVSDASLSFFVILFFALNQTGSFRFTVTSAGNLHITLVTYSWDNIINIWIPYFNMVYGIKYNAFICMQRIFILNSINTLEAAWESVHLAYALSRNAGQFLLSLPAKLLAVGCVPGALPVPSTTFLPNNTPITLAYVLGFFLGDGHCWVRFRMRDTSLLIIPLFIITQKLSEVNLIILGQMKTLLNSLGISAQVISVARTKQINGKAIDASEARLVIEGLTSVLSQLLPQLLALQPFFFWKAPQLNVLVGVARYVTVSAHLLIPGLESLVRYLFSTHSVIGDTDNRVSLSTIISFISTTMLDAANARTTTGHFMVNAEMSKHNSKLYRVRLPAFMNPKPKSKVFNVNSYGSASRALDDAIAYRDAAIKSWLSDNNL
jgi:hypothetical protein